MKSKYTREFLEPIARGSKTLSEVVRKINGHDKPVHGSMVAYIKSRLIKENVDFSHFLGRRWCSGKNDPCRVSYTMEEFINKFLVKSGPFIRTSDLKNRLIRYGLREYMFDCCGNTGTWNGKSLTLQLDHSDGDSTNNEISNLSIKCPNCHSQTDTYSGKNNSKFQKAQGRQDRL